MNDSVVITYSGQQVSVPKEVADFLEQYRKRELAQEKRDQRHLSRSEFETVLFCSDCVRRPVEDAVLRNLQLETRCCPVRIASGVPWRILYSGTSSLKLCGKPSMVWETRAGIL